MKNLATMLKPLALSVALLALFTAAQSVAFADQVTFTGSTAGCFGAGCTPTNTDAQPPGLTYFNSTFNVNTNSLGDASIGNTATPPANFNNLGSFTLTGAAGSYTGQVFTLEVNFTAPPGAGSPTFTATLTGLVEATADGNLRVDFNNDFQTFGFANGGTFQFRVNDVSITPGGTVALTGDIQGASAIPEPATMVLLGTGLAGVAAKVRRRRKAA